jgi:UDP-N-acetyl-D-mannosaminuronic acid dehydrogenase
MMGRDINISLTNLMNRQKLVSIIGGCGHVGLPLGIMLATVPDVAVRLIDIDQAKIDLVNSGVMPFQEDGMDPVLKSVAGKSLLATKDIESIRDADVVITVIGTPVDRHLNPLLKEINHHADETIDRMKDGSLLILRSTLYPGVTKLIYDKIKAKKRNIHLAACPERILQGKALDEMVSLPQIVGAFEDKAEEEAVRFFHTLTPTVICVDPLEAEFGKLMINSWRYLDFAIANQFYILCQRQGLDFYRIYNAFKYEYPRLRNTAKAGLTAGPCLLKDTLQLGAFSNNLFTLGQPGMVVNESIPNYIIEKLQPLDLPTKTVAILGMAFKGNCDDKRDSLAFKLKNLLQVYAGRVLCTDPYVPDPDFVPLETAIDEAQIIILGAPHSVYGELKFSPRKVIVDVFGFWQMEELRIKKRDPATRSAVPVEI